MPGWEDEFDEMEAHLNGQRAALAAGGARPPIYVTLPDLGPLPEALRPRAEALLAATIALEGQVIDSRDALRAALRAAYPTGAPPPAYLDQRA